ncbi:MAG: DUF2334 domain-containing protein [Butyrivibrio sp.]|nr:DUF2334 domain-containing protein [Butyrivibrio sp.]
MKIVIRMDDITPGMDWGKFNRFKKLLDENGIKPLIGVVPDCRDEKLAIDKKREDFWQLLSEWKEDGWVIALHGLNHLYTTKCGGMLPLNRQSEFAGLSYDKQYEMIKKGKEILKEKGISTDIFMAPSHSYDDNTLKALRDNGFTKLTDGFGYKPYLWKDITFFPISVNKKSVLKSDKDGIVTFVVHTNTMTDAEFNFYKDLFIKSNKVVSYSEMLNAKPDNMSYAGHIKEKLTALSKRQLVTLLGFVKKLK